MHATIKRSAGICAVLTLLALSGHPAAADSTPPGSTKTADVKAAGLSLSYPATWTVLSFTGLTKAQRKQLQNVDPKYAELYSAEAVDKLVKTTQFYAKDLDAELQGNFAGNIGVQVRSQGGFPANIGEFRQGIKSQYSTVGATDVVTSSRRVAGQTAYAATARLPYTLADGSPGTARVGQLLVPHGDGEVVFSIATTDDAAGKATIDSIVASVHKL